MSVDFWCRFGLLATLLFIPNGYAAGILSLSQAELSIKPQARLPELAVENQGDGPLYLDVTQQLLINPGSLPETLVDIGNTESPSLLVTPSRLILGPGQKRSLQLRVLAQPKKTQVWRVTFRPQQEIHVVTAGVTATRAPLRVSIGYGVVIYQTGSQQ